MARKIIVAVKQLTDPQKSAIAKEAEKKGFEAVFFETEEEAAEAAKDAEVIFSSFPGLAGKAGKLKWFCSPYAGVDDFAAPGVFASDEAVLTNSSGAYGVTISEHIVMVLLNILRQQPAYTKYIANRQWVRKLPIRSIHGSRIVMLGTGDIGQETAKKLRSFRPERIVGVNRSGRNPDGLFDEIFTIDRLDQALEKADYLIMSLPATPLTKNILNESSLSRLPDHAVIVNVGRGSSIDEAALEKELRAGRLFAALDVLQTEPLPETSTLWDCPNLYLTPHVAGDLNLPYTKETTVLMFLENLDLYCQGRPLLRTVDLKIGY